MRLPNPNSAKPLEVPQLSAERINLANALVFSSFTVSVSVLIRASSHINIRESVRQPWKWETAATTFDPVSKMSTHITVLPASTKIGRETIRLLLASPASPTIRGIYRDTSKAPDEYTSHPNFSSVKGDVASEESLDLSNSDAVLYVPPPTYENIDQSEWAKQAANNVKGALKKSGVKRLVVLSGLGSHNDHGIVCNNNQVANCVDADDVGLCPLESLHRQDSQRFGA